MKNKQGNINFTLSRHLKQQNLEIKKNYYITLSRQ